MAFGTWLKGIVSSIGSAISKALPVAKKIVQTVAPAVEKVGGIIGGKIGSGIQKFAGAASKFANSSTKLLGSGGAGISLRDMTQSGRQQIIPRFK